MCVYLLSREWFIVVAEGGRCWVVGVVVAVVLHLFGLAAIEKCVYAKDYYRLTIYKYL